MSLTKQQYEKEKAEYAAWLGSLKVGDEVAVRTNMFGEPYFILTIDRFTATQGILTGVGSIETRFRLTGDVVGDRFRRIEPVTPEITKEIRVAKLAAWGRYTCSMEISQLDSERKQKVYDLVQSLLAEQKESCK